MRSTNNADVPPALGELNIYAPNVQLINLHIHDLAGFGWWDASYGTMRGCLLRCLGYDAPDRGHGHTLYTQNAAPNLKWIESNIFIKGFGLNVQEYGSGAAHLTGYRYDGNILQGGRWIIGGTEVSDTQATDCFMYDCNINLGYTAEAHEDLSLTDSVIVGVLQIDPAWSSLTLRRNMLMGNLSFVPGTDYANIDCDDNVYIGTVFDIQGEGMLNFAQWKAETGLDVNSRWYPHLIAVIAGEDLTLPMVKLYPVNAGKHAANIAIWNPLEDVEVEVDFSAIGLANGNYELRQVRDPADVRAFVYSGSSIAVTMTGDAVAPTGNLPTPYHPEEIIASSFPQFGIFELWRV